MLKFLINNKLVSSNIFFERQSSVVSTNTQQINPNDALKELSSQFLKTFTQELKGSFVITLNKINWKWLIKPVTILVANPKLALTLASFIQPSKNNRYVDYTELYKYMKFHNLSISGFDQGNIALATLHALKTRNFSNTNCYNLIRAMLIINGLISNIVLLAAIIKTTNNINLLANKDWINYIKGSLFGHSKVFDHIISKILNINTIMDEIYTDAYKNVNHLLNKINTQNTLNAIEAINQEAALNAEIADSKWSRILNKALLDMTNVGKRLAAIFFNMTHTSYIVDPQVINLEIIQNTVLKFWSEVVVPAALDKGINVLTVQMRFKTESGEWRSMSHYTTWNINQCHEFLEFLANWINTIANHYSAAGIVISQFDFSWKLLTEADAAIKLRTSKLSQQNILNTKNFNKLANAIPLTNDYNNIEGAIVKSSRYENQWFLENVWLKNVLGLDAVKTIWNISPITASGKIIGHNVTVALSDGGTVIAKFTDIINDNSIERTFIDGSIFKFENQIITEKTAKHDHNQVMMDAGKPASWKDNVINTNLFTFDLETTENFVKKDLLNDGSNCTHPSNIELVQRNKNNPNFNINNVAHWTEYQLDSSGAPIKNLSITSIAMYNADLKNIESGSQLARQWSWFITDFNNETEMVRNFWLKVREIAIRDRIDINLIAHNSAQFDLIFILKHLIELTQQNNESPINNQTKENKNTSNNSLESISKKDLLNFLVRDNKFLAVDWSINTGKETNQNGQNKTIFRKVKLMDSFLMLPMSLAKAAIQFNVENKGSFDFNKINQPLMNPNQFKNHLIKYRNDLQKYNMQDCRVLWYVLANYAKTTAVKFHVNIFKHPTAASIAFATFRNNYLDSEKHMINITSKAMYDVLSPAYMGGACDVYKPSNPEGSKVYTYDINSEYPAMMATKLMPTGYYKHIVGPIDISNPNLIAFVKARITAPENLLVPLLPMNINGKMVAGAGTFEGMYFSQELCYALSLGYQIETTEAYIFEGRLVFDDFIKDLYKERLSYPKSNPMNYICKLIMNSTYGRFGMAPVLTDVNVFTPNDILNYHDSTKFLNITNINENLVMVTSQSIENEVLDIDSPNNNLKISLPIAAAITSYARMCIHEYKQAAAENGTLLYSDTDSIITSAPLDDSLLGPQLGQLKLENVAEKGVFLSAKVYALHNVTINGVSVPDIIKAKGLKKAVNLTFQDYVRLLDKKEVYRTYQEKWFRNMGEGSIMIKNLTSMMRINEGKRVVVTNLQDQFIDTWNIIFEDNKIVSPNTVKLGLPVVYDPESHLDQISFENSTKFYLEEGAKDPIYILKAQEKAAKAQIQALANEAAAAERAKLLQQKIYDDFKLKGQWHMFELEDLVKYLQDPTLTWSQKGKIAAAIEEKMRVLSLVRLNHEYRFYQTHFTFLNNSYWCKDGIRDRILETINQNRSPLEQRVDHHYWLAAPQNLLITAPLEEPRDVIILPSKLPNHYSGEVILLPAPQVKKDFKWLTEDEFYRRYPQGKFIERKNWIPSSEYFKTINKPLTSIEAEYLKDSIESDDNLYGKYEPQGKYRSRFQGKPKK